MLAVDTSVIISYFQGQETPETVYLRQALLSDRIAISPVVLTELYSNPKTIQTIKELEDSLFVLPIHEGFWERAGKLRGKARKNAPKSHIGDALIAQSCIDHEVPLLTSDADFKHYVKAGGLKLATKIT